MSKILKAILEAAEIKDQKRDEDRQEFLARVAKAVSEMTDKEWDSLPKEAQKWYNDACDVSEANAKNKKKEPLPDFPDLEEEKQEASTPRRRGTASEDDGKGAGAGKGKDEPTAAKVGMTVKLTTQKGREYEGKVVEVDKKIIVLDVDGREKEFDFEEDVGSIEIFNDGAGKGKDEPREPQKGDEVVFTTKRGRKVQGELVKIDEDEIVVKTDEGEEDFMRSRIDGEIEVLEGKRGGSSKTKDDDGKGAGKGKDETTSTTRRRGSGSDDDGKGTGKDKDGERTRSSNGGVSVGQRIRELIVENLDATQDEIAKLLKKDGLEFRDNTLALGYAETHKLLKLLKEKKLLKG